MRIIAGQYRGRVIRTLPGYQVRPTSERVREALFDILGELVRGARVLDLFAGSGALGLEALSRGAFSAVFVEKFRPAVRVIGENVESLGVRPQTWIISRELEEALRKLRREGRTFDLILTDPPYRFSRSLSSPKVTMLENVLFLLGRYDTLHKNGVLVLEHFARFDPATEGIPWRRFRRAVYGQTCLSFFVKISPYERSGGLRG